MAAMTGAAESGAWSRKILVVEDEAHIAKLVGRTLTAAGFDVATAPTGLRGLDLMRTEAFDLVILDLMLPDVDGLSILNGIQETDPDLQVLVMSALGDVHSKVRCLEVGACDYITKPFDLPELVARVRLRVREHRRHGKSRVLQRAGYSLDLQKRVVTSAAGTITLSTREFVLLDYLMTRAGSVCARDELLEHVWGYTFDPATNVLDVYVGRLRGKLGADCIQTVRNVGYLFVDA